MMTDPIADMLTKIRNANIAYHEKVDIPYSEIKKEIARIMKSEGFIKIFQVLDTGASKTLRIFLKYGPNRERVITNLKRISKPGLRIYVKKDKIPKIFGGMGVVILSTSKGILTGKEARKMGVGGEILCYVW